MTRMHYLPVSHVDRPMRSSNTQRKMFPWARVAPTSVLNSTPHSTGLVPSVPFQRESNEAFIRTHPEAQARGQYGWSSVVKGARAHTLEP